MRAQADALKNAGRLADAREALECAVRALDGFPDRFFADRLYALSSLAKVHSDLWDVKSANRTIERAWDALVKARLSRSLTDPDLMAAAATLFSIESRLCEQMPRADLQLAFALSSLSLVSKSDGQNAWLLAWSYIRVAQAHCRLGNFTEAMQALGLAQEQTGRLPQPDPDLKAHVLDQFARLYSDQGDLVDAIRVRREIIGWTGQKFGRTNMRYIGTLRALGYDLFRAGAFDEASVLCVQGQLLFNEHLWSNLAMLPIGRRGGIGPLRGFLAQLACLAALSDGGETARRNAAYVSALSKGLETAVWSAQAMLNQDCPVGSLRAAIEGYWSSLSGVGGVGGAEQVGEGVRPVRPGISISY